MLTCWAVGYGETRMRELTSIELQAVSGGAAAVPTRPVAVPPRRIASPPPRSGGGNPIEKIIVRVLEDIIARLEGGSGLKRA